MIASCFFFSLLGGVIKFIGNAVHPFEQAFFRNFFCIFFFVPILLFSRKRKSIKSERKKFLVIRSLFGGITMLLLFWSYTLIPLSQAMVISFTTPLFIFFGSIFFFKEKPTPMSLFGLILGFLITVIIIRPDSSFQFGTLIALLAAITHAIAGLMVKDLTKTESIFSIMTYMILFMTPITFIPAIFVWELPNDIQIWLSLVSLAVIGTLGNFCWTKAISISQMTNIMPFDFSKLIFATIIGFFFFNEEVSPITFIGGLGLIVCNILIAKK
ncbi:DMT family transporter [Rickettsiales bacterium]|nr:DMT family transporter [Rickettsiales bacterium]